MVIRNGWVMPGTPAAPHFRAYTDQANAASVPMEMSVSMVAVPCRRFVYAALWNGHAAQVTTGVARTSENHCQYSNCQAGTMAMAITGTDRTIAPISRCSSGSMPAGSSGSVFFADGTVAV